MRLIVDLTRLSAAYATRLLAEAGNRVVRVETATGDDVRRTGPFIRELFDLEHGTCHQFLNAGKESVVLDPATADGAQALQALLRVADCAIVTQPFCRDAAWFLEANPALALVEVAGDRYADGVDFLVVFVLVAVGFEEVRVDLHGAVEIEAADAEDLVHVDGRILAAMHRRGGVDRMQTLRELIELCRRDEVGLVEQDDVGERDLLLRLTQVVKVLHDVLAIHHRDDGVELQL